MRLGLGAGARTLDEAVAEGRQAAADGFDALWFSNIFGLDALTACAVVGREVPGLTVGTAVVPTYPRHPHALAQQAATVQQAAGGRLVLGIGLSHQVVVEAMFGLSYDKPARHMREYLSVLLPLLREGRVAHEGEVYTVRAGLEVTAPELPVVVAALGPVMLGVAGALADGTSTWMTGVKTLRDHVVPAMTTAAEQAGRPAPRVVVGLPVCVTDDVASARAAGGRGVRRLRAAAVLPGDARPGGRRGPVGRRAAGQRGAGHRAAARAARRRDDRHGRGAVRHARGARPVARPARPAGARPLAVSAPSALPASAPASRRPRPQRPTTLPTTALASVSVSQPATPPSAPAASCAASSRWCTTS